jgi:type I restriction enzyme R subunit
MSGSASDMLNWQKHIRCKKRREEVAKVFKNPKKPFRTVTVRDMWLTGYDAPSLHTTYVDKPMRVHGLMQATARVNRVNYPRPLQCRESLEVLFGVCSHACTLQNPCPPGRTTIRDNS